jgi:hypothetical protein
MPFVWTDELARLLLSEGIAAPEQVEGWLRRPVGLAVADGVDLAEVGRELLGLGEREDGERVA